jgi:hypothetical protein
MTRRCALVAALATVVVALVGAHAASAASDWTALVVNDTASRR